MTDNVKSRLDDLQTASAESLNVLGVMSGGRSEEKELHGRFRFVRVRGEWFEPHELLLQFIAEKAIPFTLERVPKPR